jgi:tyrosine-protein phosphatase YwqE
MRVLRQFFRKPKPLDPIDLSLIGVDLHSHLLPGIDDGAPDLAASLYLIKGFVDLGYRKIITTPHVMSDFYRNTSSIIRSKCDEVVAACRQDGVDIAFEAAAEYYLDEHFDRLIDQGDVLTFGNQHVLFELPFMTAPDMMKNVLFKLQMAGYRPILAHPERYPYWHRETDKYRELADRDVLLQLNAGSLSGFYGIGVQRCAEWLIEQGLVSFIASDCHHPGHLNLLNEVRTSPYLHRLVDSGKLLNQTL